MPLIFILFLIASLLHLPAAAEPPHSWQEAATLPELADFDRAAAPPALGQALAGRWTGTLQYRDYSSDKRVTLPTSVTIEGPSAVLQLAFTYDDGPGKTVRSTEQWTLDGAQFGMGKAEPLQVSTYRSKADGDLILVALGKGVENDVAVEVRSVVLRRGAVLTISRASRLPGQAWLLRHVYRLTPAQ